MVKIPSGALSPVGGPVNAWPTPDSLLGADDNAEAILPHRAAWLEFPLPGGGTGAGQDDQGWSSAPGQSTRVLIRACAPAGAGDLPQPARIALEETRAAQRSL